MATAMKLGVQYLKQLALANIADLLTILVWNEDHGIRLFRITSNLFPHMGNHEIKSKDPYYRGDIDFARDALRRVGRYAQAKGHRLTFHMNPFVQLGATNEDVAERSIFDIVMYQRIYEAMGVRDTCVVLHGGGVYHDPKRHVSKEEAKAETLARWLKRYKELPAAVQRTIVLENDERHYGVRDLLGFCQKNKIPFCLDVFHNSISADSVPVTSKLLQDVIATWSGKKAIAKFHLSEQDPNLRFGAHAAEVHTIPKYFFDLKHNSIDIMIEAKNKEQVVLKLHHKYHKHLHSSSLTKR